ncbi:MAG TPA: class I SAM-dependent methyltransferase [Tepidisphaeraceae bacterium]|jgi:predicted O-methyltransferase YrrM|nr:class I SAM-dependent methyltransferase [Tepidisphaeraceae bacterium]
MGIDKQILSVIEELDELRKTRDDAWQIPRIEGELLHQFAFASNAKMIVEVGTSYGFSGLFWAAALQRTGGTLHTIDISQKKFDASKDNFRRAGLGDLVVNHLGDAVAVLPTLRGPVDIAFLDGIDKKQSQRYFELIWPALRRGGSVFTDNTKTHPDELADYMKFARSRPDALSTEIPVGNGVEWTVKL